MIDELLFRTNHLGKDGFIWWIGQVAPPDYWKEDTQHTNYKDPAKADTNWPERCKVRIIGYHPFDNNELDHKDLPLAHIMMDPTFGSGQGGEGVTSNLTGGEVCFGFFLDGEDAQQPVIVGLMSRNRQTVNEPLGNLAFRPFTGYQDTVPLTRRPSSQPAAPKEAPKPPTGKDTQGNIFEYNPDLGGYSAFDLNINPIPFNPSLNLVGIDTTTNFTGGINYSDYLQTSTENAAYTAFIKSTTFTYTYPTECRNNLIGQITQILQDFIGFTNGIQKYANKYIDPVLNTFVDIASEVKSVASSIGGVIRLIINSLRSAIIKCVTSLFRRFFNTQVDPLKTILSQSFKNIINIIFCLFEKLIPELLDFLEKLLIDLVDNVFSAPACAINQWVAGILSKVMDSIDKALSTILSGINWLTGGLSNVFSVLNNASTLAKQIYNFIGCDDLKCSTPSKWVSNIGPSKESTDNWDSMVKNIDVLKGFSDDLGSVESAIAGLPLYSNSSYSTGTFVTNTKRILTDDTVLTIVNPGIGYTAGITTYLNVNLISLTGIGKGAKATIGVGTGKVFYARVTKKGEKYETGDNLTIDYRDTNNQGKDVVLSVPQVKIKQNTYYKACADKVNNPSTQDDLPPNSGSTKHKKCIPPKIEVFGDGIGAVLKPIITEGKLIHVDITSPGLDYSYPPLLNVVDKSGHGKGASLLSEIDDKGSIKNVIVSRTGEGYCPITVGIGESDSYDIDKPLYVYLSTSSFRIYEGESVTFTVKCIGENIPSAIKYEISGISEKNIKQPLSGEIAINSKTGTITIDTIEDDNLTSDVLTFKLVDYNKKISVLVDDITENPETSTKEYILSSNLYSINEGSKFKITLRTKNVKNDETVPFNIQIDNEDLIQNYSSYSEFKIFNDKSELEFKTNKGIIQKNVIFKLELQNKKSSVRVFINKLNSSTGIGTTSGGGTGIGTTAGGGTGGGGGINTTTSPKPQLCLTGLKIVNPGYGYNVRDKATDGINNYDLIISPDNGAIFGAASIPNQICGYDEPPVIIVPTDTGNGVKILPIMTLDKGNSNSIVNTRLPLNLNTSSIITGISSDSINVVDCV